MIGSSKHNRKRIVITVMTLVMLCIAPLSVAAAQKTEGTEARDVSLEIDGKKLKLGEPARMADGKLFMPAARLAQLLDAQTQWDQDNEEVTVHTAYGDTIVLGNGVPVVYFNDKRYLMDTAPFLADGRMYVPVRHLAEMLHAEVKWSAEDQRVEITTVRPVAVTEEVGLAEIGKQLDVGKTALLKRNGIADADSVKIGTELKVVVPSIFEHEAKPYTEQDLMLLAKITQVESGYESYEGQLAVANVILNRVKDPRFPDTIRDVIYSGKQFPVAHNGMLDKAVPNKSVMRAAKDALNGKCNVEGAIYFYNPRVTSGPFWSSLEVVANIGNHRFAKS